MRRIKSRRFFSPMNAETLEARQLLSSTVTTIAVANSAVLGQEITVTADVTSNGTSVSTGTVALLNDGQATGLTSAVNASGVATFSFGAGNALYAGNYSLTAEYMGSAGADASTSAPAALAVALPNFVTQSDGLGIATVTAGSGPGAVTGDTLTVQYTGFYQSNGSEFDESSAHSPGTFSYTLYASPEQVITGFDEGTAGITLGETRVVDIPSALGYMDGMSRIFVIQDVGTGLVAVGPATQLSIAGSPITSSVGQTIQTPVTVNVVDANNNVVTSDGSDITLSIASGPAGAALGGTTTLQAQGGEASFDDLTFSEPGSYTLTASDGSLLPADTVSITVTAAASSLTPTLGKVAVPTAALVGGKIAAKVTTLVSNDGDAYTGSTTVNIFADSGTSLDGNQVLLGSLTRKPPIKADKSAPFTVNIKTLPAALAAGTYYLIAQVVDPTGATNEVTTSQTLQVAAPFVQPEVTIDSMSPVSIASNKSGVVVVTVVNDGNIPATGFSLTLSPSTDGVTPTTQVLAHLTNGQSFKPGKAKTFRLHFKATSALQPGMYQAYVSVSLAGITTSAVSTATFTID